MEKIKKVTIISIILLVCSLQRIGAQSIPTTFFGMNYWMPSTIPIYPVGSVVPAGFVDNSTIQTLTKNAGASFFRIGGGHHGTNGYDQIGTAIGTDAAHNDYIAAMASVLAVNPNANFIVQIPFDNASASATNAGLLVSRVETYRLALAASCQERVSLPHVRFS